MTITLKEAINEVTFIHMDEGGVRAWSITRLDDLVSKAVETGKLEIVNLVLDPEWVKFCRQNRGIEQHRIDRMTPENLLVPVYGFMRDDGSFLLVDGHHRYVYAVEVLKKETIWAVIIPQEMMEMVRIENFPQINEKLLHMIPSGL